PVSSALEPESEHRPEPESEAEKTSVFAPFEQAESGSLFESGKETGSLFEPSRETGSLFDTGHEAGSLFEPAQEQTGRHGLLDEREEAAEPAPPAYAFGGDSAPVAHEETPVESTQVLLPKRQPKTPPRGTEMPQLSPPSMRAIERREPLDAEGRGRSGSLFEPAVSTAGGTGESRPLST
ncbi:hypothetical protein, partial [Hymenobacter terrigena]